MSRKVTIEFDLNEIEVMLLIWLPREQQQLGPFAASARAKLLKARAELLERFVNAEEPIARSLFDGMEEEQ